MRWLKDSYIHSRKKSAWIDAARMLNFRLYYFPVIFWKLCPLRSTVDFLLLANHILLIYDFISRAFFNFHMLLKLMDFSQILLKKLFDLQKLVSKIIYSKIWSYEIHESIISFESPLLTLWWLNQNYSAIHSFIYL